MYIFENSFIRNFIVKNNFINNSKSNRTNSLKYKVFQTIPLRFSATFKKKPAVNVLNKDYTLNKKLLKLQDLSNKFNNKSKEYFGSSFGKGKSSSLTKNNYNNKLLVKKGGTIFCLRKIYIILPENIKIVNGNLSMKIYFPIKDADIKINKISINEEGIFCYNIDDIFDEVKKKLGIYCNSNEIKLNMYNEDFNVITNSNQLMEKSAKNKLIYVKIGKIFSEQNIKNNNFCFQYNKKKDNSKINFLLNQKNKKHFISKSLEDFQFNNNDSLYNCNYPIKTKRYSLSNFNKENRINFFTMTTLEKTNALLYSLMGKSLSSLTRFSNLIPETKKSKKKLNIYNGIIPEEKNNMHFPRIKSKGLWKSNSNLVINNINKNQKNISPRLNFQNKFINNIINLNKENKQLLCESTDSNERGNRNNSRDKITLDISGEI